ncbi:MAG TPA: M50 family metallopeptidase, partial [Verrucomicrobiae bacterium]|nr:M50 family metallopeptidase [Verrucomicrobiae bacterium]
PVSSFISLSQDSIKWRIVTSEGTNIPIKYERDGEVKMAYPVPVRPPTKWYERKSLRQIEIGGTTTTTIAEVASNSPAALAGLKPGDKIVALNGTKLYSFYPVVDLQESWSNSPAQPVTLTVKRGSEQFDRTLTPVRPIQPTNSHPMLGILAWQPETNITMLHPNPVEQINASVSQIYGLLHAVMSPKSNIGVQQIGGAVLIARVYYNLFQDKDAWRRALWFSVILNVNLALLNLLPLPVLDGGHITLALLEAIRRRPVSARILNSIQTAFAVLLIGFMLYIAFFDTSDWVRSAQADRNVPIVFAPDR